MRKLKEYLKSKFKGTFEFWKCGETLKKMGSGGTVGAGLGEPLGGVDP